MQGCPPWPAAASPLCAPRLISASQPSARAAPPARTVPPPAPAAHTPPQPAGGAQRERDRPSRPARRVSPPDLQFHAPKTDAVSAPSACPPQSAGDAPAPEAAPQLRASLLSLDRHHFSKG